MKVELNGATASELAAEKSVKPAPTPNLAAAETPASDRTTFHSDQAVQSLTNHALQSPEIRQPVVETLRQSVSSGSYEVNASQTATAIISHES